MACACLPPLLFPISPLLSPTPNVQKPFPGGKDKCILLVVISLQLFPTVSTPSCHLPTVQKPFLGDKEKRILLVVIPLQVFANIAIIITEEESPSVKDWFTWRDVFHLVRADD